MCSCSNNIKKDISKKYSKIICHLLVDEQNNDLVMKNHENQSARSESLCEVNEAYTHCDIPSLKELELEINYFFKK